MPLPYSALQRMCALQVAIQVGLCLAASWGEGRRRRPRHLLLLQSSRLLHCMAAGLAHKVPLLFSLGLSSLALLALLCHGLSMLPSALSGI